ncbi:MAG: L-rhamnose isomerase [Clostridiales Family XIII bacterium]|nr:L-rhamnose isomerase [Clostridiales Family XIII bacterium]
MSADTEKNYAQAKEAYAAIGVDSDAAIGSLEKFGISMHCWQGDDVIGFDHDGPLTGGIQTTGDYPGRARTPEELMADIDKVFSLVGGKRHKLNLHASYAVFKNGSHDRDVIEPGDFSAWVDYAKARGLGLDMNPTYFSHGKAGKYTLASPDAAIRDFWVEHGRACVRVSQHFAEALGQPCLLNIWIPDGSKDVPADRIGPRERFAESMDRTIAEPHDKDKVYVAIESKVFGIGLESYTVGSAEFGLCYAASRGIVPLFDNGHYHPTEMVSDKISSALTFFDKLALHITRPVRWDSDHVVRFDDEVREIANEIVRCGVDRVFVGTDWFDAGINRIAAWVIGMRCLQKAMLSAFLTPHAAFKKMQDECRDTELFVRQEELKTLPLGAVWDMFCERAGVPGAEWYGEVENYEKEVLSKRS